MNGSEEDDGRPSCSLYILLVQPRVGVVLWVLRLASAVHVVQRIQQVGAVLHGKRVLSARLVRMHLKEKRNRLFKVGQVKFDHDGSSLLFLRNNSASLADFNDGAVWVPVAKDANRVLFVNSANAPAHAPLARKK